ncbi:transglycosylase SLT domain-containing protein [Acaryochloris sp. IP29b_bin.148]|uniref:transglycosylase SLT domain-containing protein n=1 Tax=Acaryochloris sp. IP29b_bin.148 TaxID=2969218 RepID=UPI00262C1A57|nr:transglycosylase SLT domain-containing protein [Acaryochloris sp. IP29b_bin.148]
MGNFSRHLGQILKRLAPWTLSLGLSTVLVLGLSWLFLKPKLEPSADRPRSQQVSPINSALAALRSIPAQQRLDPLKQLAQQGTTQEQNQARYVLAADLVQLQQGEEALRWLEGLEERYPLLASHIAVLHAQAQTQAGQTEQAETTWQRILADYPQEPAAAEALFVLGNQNPDLWQQAITDFPAHPQTVEIAVAQLQKKPKQLKPLMLIAKHGLFLPNYGDYLTQLTQNFKAQLKPSDWQIVAFGYWEKQLYKEGALAYAQAPQTSQTAYRAARGLQLGGEQKKAIAAYQKMIAAYPNAKETPLALSKLASLEKDLGQAAQHYDRAFQLSKEQQPTLAAQVLGERIQRLQKAKQPSQTLQQTLLEQFSQTDDAAALRWQQAEKQRQAGNLPRARQLALQIQAQNPNSRQAAAAVFWAGKWASSSDERQTAFQTLWKTYPDSYYAWRAAVLSGWTVGDFNSIRSFQPQIQFPSTQLPLAAGSPALQELYQLGQHQTAWERWQWEFRNRQEPSLSEQLTDGLLRLGVRDYLDGIYMLANLETRAREEQDSEQQVKQWQDHPGFEQALFPLAYFTPIRKWSNQRNLNPFLVLSLMRQESRFQPKIRSVAGAVGLMQVLPETAEWVSGKAGLKTYEIDGIDDNINLGTWYLDYTHRNYNDNSMLAIASYNAGPGNVDRWVQQTAITDVDMFVEDIPFPETKNYVKSVSENYWNYLRLYNPQIQQLMRAQANPSDQPNQLDSSLK